MVAQSLDRIQSRIDQVLRLNRSMTSHSDDVIARLVRLRRLLDDKYAHAHADIRSVAQLAAQLQAMNLPTKYSLELSRPISVVWYYR